MSNDQPIKIPSQEFPIYLSEKAHDMALRATQSEGKQELNLRVSVRGGGCAGLNYSLDIDDSLTPFDIKTQLGDLSVVVDIFSLQYLANTTIDYEENLGGAGFRFNNPNARKTCGCGSSFA